MATTLEIRVKKLELKIEAFEVIFRAIERLCTEDKEAKEKFIAAVNHAMANKPYDPLQIDVKRILKSVK